MPGLVAAELRAAPLLRATLGASILLDALGAGATALAAGLLGRALVEPHALAAVTGTSRAIPAGNAVLSTLTLGVLATLVKATGGVLLAYCEGRLAGNVGASLRGRVVATLLGEGLQDLEPRVLATVATQLREVEAAVPLGVVLRARSLAQLLPLALALIVLSPPWMGLLALAGLAPVFLGVGGLRRAWRKGSERAQESLVELQQGVDDLVRNVDLWRSFGAGPTVAASLAASGRLACRQAARVEAGRAALSGFNEVVAALALLGLVASAGSLGPAPHEATLVGAAVVFFLSYRPLRDLGDSRAWLARGTDALRKILLVLSPAGSERHHASRSVPANSIVDHDAPVPLLGPSLAPPPLGSDAGSPEEPICAAPGPGTGAGAPRTGAPRTGAPRTGQGSARKTVGAGAPGEPPRPNQRPRPGAGGAAAGPFGLAKLEVREVGALSRGPRTSFEVEPGDCIAVMGATGSGKTTLLRVLLGLEAGVGTVTYDGQDLSHAPAGPNRPFAWVPQDAPLIAGSLADNVALRSARPEAVRAALRRVGAAGLLESCGDAPVGPGGRRLSGGERQLVAIARALISGQPVLLLDEPTAGLDPDSARRVLGALTGLAGDRSLVLVTHRLEVAAIASGTILVGDRLAPMASGTIPVGHSLPRR